MTSSLSKEELEKNIDTLTNEYNTNVEDLVETESELSKVKSRGFELLKKLYEQKKFHSFSNPNSLNGLEKEYNDNNSVISEKQTEYYDKQTICFKQIQKLRQLQHTYLVGIINGLQKEISELKSSQNTEDITHSINKRENNL